jgi:hypothetical protein
VTCVARAFGVPFPTVLYDWPWEDVLLAWYGLEEVERIERLEREVEQLQAAFLTNYAVNAPKSLMKEQTALRARLKRGPVDLDTPDEATLLADALAFGELLRRNTEGAS